MGNLLNHGVTVHRQYHSSFGVHHYSSNLFFSRKTNDDEKKSALFPSSFWVFGNAPSAKLVIQVGGLGQAGCFPQKTSCTYISVQGREVHEHYVRRHINTRRQLTNA